MAQDNKIIQIDQARRHRNRIVQTAMQIPAPKPEPDSKPEDAAISDAVQSPSRLKQRMSGIALLAITALTVTILDGDITIALFTVPSGFYLIFTKEILIKN